MASSLQRVSRILPWLALALVSALVSIAYRTGFDRAAWSLPTSYHWDGFEGLTRIKAASEGDLSPLGEKRLSRLGAPGQADWSEYPVSDELAHWLLGKLARRIGLAETTHVALALSHVLAALAFYGVCRALGHGRPWAFAGALLYSFAFHNLQRGFEQWMLTLSWTIPPALWSCWVVATSRRLRLRSGWMAAVLLTAAALGIGNPYNAFLYGQLMALAMVVHGLGGRRRWINLQAGALALVAMAAAFALFHYDTIAYGRREGKNEGMLVRGYADAERQALKLIDLAVPPPEHRLPAFAAIGDRYDHVVYLRSEMFSAYLGVAGLLALAGLAFVTLRRLARPRATSAAPPGIAWQGLYIMLFSTVGGLGAFLAAADFDVFRATNRYSMFLLALALVFAASWLSRRTRTWPAAVTWTLALLVAALGLCDQIPRRPPPATIAGLHARVNSDRHFARTLEQALPPAAAVFQLPAVEFLEAPHIHLMSDYALVRPYLWSQTLRFSYGALRGRGHIYWLRELEALAPAELIPALERRGFAALHLNRRAYPDGGAAFLQALRQLPGYRVVEDRAGEQLAVLLHPRAAAEPAFRALLWRGWAEEEGVAWSGGEAEIKVFNREPQAQSAALALRLQTRETRTIELRAREALLWRGEVGPEGVDLVTEVFPLPPGETRVRVSGGRVGGRLARMLGSGPRTYGASQPHVFVGEEAYAARLAASTGAGAGVVP